VLSGRREEWSYLILLSSAVDALALAKTNLGCQRVKSREDT